jgi:RHS repeat-associated protein
VTRSTRLVALALTAAVALAAADQAPAAAAPVSPFQPLEPQTEHVVPATAGTSLPYAPDPAAAAALKPSPTTARAALPATGTPAVRATAAGGASIQVLDRATTAAALPAATVMRVKGAGPTPVSVDTTGLRRAYGGDWTNRLQLEQLPECALTTPAAAGCQGTPLASRNSGSAVTATVSASAGSGTLVALAAGPSGSTGSFAATSLAASGAWEAGGPSGDFSWSYSLRAPPALGGPEPTLTLAYSAQSVDGRMAMSNNQPSWIGQGFDMWSGYIERSYKSCADDMGGSANNTTKTGDECWGTDNATMSLGGKTAELIKDDATGAWHPKADDGSRIEHLTGASNGALNGEYWRVTTANGTQYYFGLNHLPGWSSGKPVTGSTWTVPVFGNNPGEPCYQSSFDKSSCTQAWRWNLDYVVDPHGNSMSYWYATETNDYARNLTSSEVSSYVRGGTLSEIDYGTRTTAEFGTAPQRVLFTVADRCIQGDVCDTAHPASWPDVPWDQSCTSSTSCTDYSPTFFSQKRLASVRTQVWGGAAYRDVEQWTFNQSYPDNGDGTMPGLWLAGISHSGLVGGTASVPDVTFTGVQLPNRVDAVGDGAPAMNWWRVASIRTETGGEIDVQYSAQDCVAGSRMPSSPSTNTLRCYPVIWTPQGDTSPITDYFNKYVVTAVIQTDHTGMAPRTIDSYTYIGSPNWHYTDDDGLTPPSRKTWSEWRGYQKVGVTKGDPGAQSYGETLYYTGMDGDHLPSGTRSASLTDSFGGVVADGDPFSGQAREQITYDGAGGAIVSDVITDHWQSAPSATRTQNGVTTHALFTNIAGSTQRIALDGGRGYRTTRTATAYDQYGSPIQVTDYGDVNSPGDAHCTLYTYARNTSAWLINYPSEVETYAGVCGTPPSSAGQIFGDSRTSYDGQAWGAPPTHGDVTQVQQLKDWAGGATTFVTSATSAYDANGRLTDMWDAGGSHTQTAYLSSAGGPVTQTKVTNPLGWVTTNDVEPAFGITTGTTDQNGRRTDVTLDPLGRTTAVWLPGRARGVQSASTTYSYLLSTTSPTAVTTSTLGPNGAYVTTYALYDGLLRPRQTQAPAVGSSGDVLVTDTLYDTAGRAYKSNATYVVSGTPGTTLVVPTGDNQIAAQTLTLFDGANRPVASIFDSFGVEQWRTTTAYGGDHTDVTPPAGGFATSTITDARGRKVELRQYHGGTPSGPYDSTKYTYTAQDQPATVTDTAGNAWSYGYDTQGRQTSATSPDTGTATSTYDDAGHLLTTTDARGQTLAYTYDVLGRKTGEFSGSTSGAQLASWTYDTIAKGQLTSATRLVSGSAYVSAVTGYDSAYRPTGTKITIPAAEGALAGTYQYATTYKPDGSVSTMTVPAAGGLPQEVLGYSYLDTGQPSTLSGTQSYVTQAQYTQLGEPAVYTLSTGGAIAQVGYFYDEATRRLAELMDVRQTAPSTIADQHYTYTAAGDVTKIADTPNAAPADTQCFTYDALRRLSAAWTPAGGDCTAAPSSSALGGPAPYWQSYAYDAVGDRATLVDHAAGGDTTTSYAYPAAGAAQPHALLSTTANGPSGSTTASYGYDPAGHTTSRPGPNGGQSLTWDAEGHVATVAGGTGTASYVYDAGGNRLVAHDSTGATLYLPGMELHVTPAGAVTATRYYAFGGAVVAQRTGSGVTWLMSDRQGTTQVAVASGGSQAVSERYEKPFGDPRGTPPAWANPHGFVGGVDDPTGLVHLSAREYDPSTGRFVSSDPALDLGSPPSMLGYAYGGDNPVTNSDPSGLRFITEGGGGGGGGSSQPPPQNPSYPPPAPQPAPPKPAPPQNCGWFGLGCVVQAVAKVAAPVVNWVDQHKSDVVNFVVSTAVTAGCDIATGGAGSIACGALGGAAGAAAGYLMDTLVDHKSQFSWAGLGGSTVAGAVGGALGAFGGKLLGPALQKAGGFIGKVIGKIAGKGADEVATEATAGAAEEAAGTAAEDVTKTAAPQKVYRGGSATANNMTPHPVKDPTGLSTFDSLEAAVKPGGKAQVIDTSLLKQVVAHPDGIEVGPGGAEGLHVSLQPPDMADLPAWAAFKNPDPEAPVHPYTQDVIDAIVDVVTRPKE